MSTRITHRSIARRRARAMVALTRTFANAADTVIVPTRAMETRLRELGVDAPIAIVPSSIDVERFATGRRIGRGARVARRARRRAHRAARVAIGQRKKLSSSRSMRSRTRATCISRSSATARIAPRSKRARDARGVDDRVRFTGALAPAALPDIYASSDAFVFPSRTETQGLVLAEALAAGLPVVAVDTPATRDVLPAAGALVARRPARVRRAIASAPRPARRDPGAVQTAFDRFGTEPADAAASSTSTAPPCQKSIAVGDSQSAVHLALSRCMIRVHITSAAAP